jgi:hypothetical protein
MVNILKDVISPGIWYNPYKILGTKVKGGTPVLDPKEYIARGVEMEISSSQPELDWVAGEEEIYVSSGEDEEGMEKAKEEIMGFRNTWETLFKFPADFVERAGNTMGSTSWSI